MVNTMAPKIHWRSPAKLPRRESRFAWLASAIWTAKEAISKALRCGMTCPFQVFEISQPDRCGYSVSGFFEKFRQYRFLALPVFERYVLGIVVPRHAGLVLDAHELEEALR